MYHSVHYASPPRIDGGALDYRGVVTIPQRDAVRTRADLLTVATEVFAADGYSGARVDEIAERTRTTKRMIYYYFENKEGLYRAVLEEAYRGIRRLEATLDLDALDPVTAVRELAALTFDHHVSHPAFIRLVSVENIHEARSLRQITSLRDESTPAKTVLDTILERGRREGVFRSDVDALDVHMVISAYCVFQVANRHTFGHLFDLDFDDPAGIAHRRGVLSDLVVSWLTPRDRA